MDILGIGIPELVFIVLIALVVLGPKDMQKAGKNIGSHIRKIVTSPEWRAIKNASKQARTLPQEWIREAEREAQGLIGDLSTEKNVQDILPESGRLKSDEGENEVLADGKDD